MGILLGWYRPLEAYLNPLLQLLRQTNPVSLFPAFILFFGIGYATNVAIIYWVVVWPILLGTVNFAAASIVSREPLAALLYSCTPRFRAS